MKITSVYVRFYKSFNFDYLRKTHRDYRPDLWDKTPEGHFYPFVRVPIEPSITAVVGANEAGKSQLLKAVEIALAGGDQLESRDFCRYSEFLVVDAPLRRPDFGLELSGLTSTERSRLGEMGVPLEEGTATVNLFRFGDGRVTVYWQAEAPPALPDLDDERPLDDVAEAAEVEQSDAREEQPDLSAGTGSISADADGRVELDEDQGVEGESPDDDTASTGVISSEEKGAQEVGWRGHDLTDEPALQRFLPSVRWIKADVPLPNEVPLAYLADPEANAKVGNRKVRQALSAAVAELSPSMFESAQAIKQNVEAIRAAVAAHSESPRVSRADIAQRALADKLLSVAAGIPRETFAELIKAIDEGDEGHRQALIAGMNDVLSAQLNIRRYWTQDREFDLLVDVSDRDLVFTMRDRTGTRYRFDERSQGMRYFLSYFVQYISDRLEEHESEILLMDEPDAFLSSQGQQDLLRIFQEFAFPPGDQTAAQVVYVTHSPFMIDKNHGERIRVLERGDGDEGVRVVRNVSKNHYEPLRSSFGGFVGETTFIGNCNLILEGIADQVLLVALSNFLRASDRSALETLDLNAVTLVPAGGTRHVPYVAYLARGLDEDKPAVIVLLDSDKPGNEARESLLEEFPDVSNLIDERYILQVGDVADSVDSDSGAGVEELEDLIPLDLVGCLCLVCGNPTRSLGGGKGLTD